MIRRYYLIWSDSSLVYIFLFHDSDLGRLKCWECRRCNNYSSLIIQYSLTVVGLDYLLVFVVFVFQLFTNQTSWNIFSAIEWREIFWESMRHSRPTRHFRCLRLGILGIIFSFPMWWTMSFPSKFARVPISLSRYLWNPKVTACLIFSCWKLSHAESTDRVIWK